MAGEFQDDFVCYISGCVISMPPRTKLNGSRTETIFHLPSNTPDQRPESLRESSYLPYLFSPKHLLAHSCPLPFQSRNLLHCLNKIVADPLAYDAVLLILLMSFHKMPDPLGARPQLPGSALADQIKVASEITSCFDVNINTVQVGLDKGDQTREAIAVRMGLAIDDFVDRHESILVFDGARRGA